MSTHELSRRGGWWMRQAAAAAPPPVVSANDQVAALHATYIEVTGLEISCPYERECAWVEFIKRGFTTDDLKLVVAEIRKGISAGERRPAALMFRNLIQDIGRFEEDLCSIRAKLRGRKTPAQIAKQSVLQSAGRPDAEPTHDAKAGRELAAAALRAAITAVENTQPHH
jgi:hypothetical protein